MTSLDPKAVRQLFEAQYKILSDNLKIASRGAPLETISLVYEDNVWLFQGNSYTTSENKLTEIGLNFLIEHCGATNCNIIIETLRSYNISVVNFIKYINEHHKKNLKMLFGYAQYISITPSLSKKYATLAPIEEAQRKLLIEQKKDSFGKRLASLVSKPIRATSHLVADTVAGLDIIPGTTLLGDVLEFTSELAGAYGGLSLPASESLMYKNILHNMNTTFISLTTGLNEKLERGDYDNAIRFNIYAVVFELYMCIGSFTRNFQEYLDISRETVLKDRIAKRPDYQINLLATSANFNSCIPQYEYLLDETMQAIDVNSSIKKMKGFINTLNMLSGKKIEYREISNIITNEEHFKTINQAYERIDTSKKTQIAGKLYGRYTRRNVYDNKYKIKKNRTKRYNIQKM